MANAIVLTAPTSRFGFGKSLRGLLILGLFSLLAACASVGGERGGSAPAVIAATAPPVVDDPAPIVTGTMRPYQIKGRWYRPEEQPGYDEVGLASWYGDQFNGRPTATGERFDMHALTAAHKTLPLPGLVEVTNLTNGRRVVLRVNDRGPFVDSRIIDLSRGAAEQLDLIGKGVGEVRVRYLGRAPRLGGGPLLQAAAPAARSIPRPAPALPEPPSTFWVQAGSFGDPLPARLMAEGIGAPASVSAANVGGRELYRVLVGPWPDANAAEAARQSVVARGYADASLISTR
ncbi:septal ring lytic transglycosylase RlpA family protein [Brevundimonas sp. PAMC22021]|nr:septal ring lytic transglycosylase RlpA family protein [Brevundimonas sp. PAMC22021]